MGNTGACIGCPNGTIYTPPQFARDWDHWVTVDSTEDKFVKKKRIRELNKLFKKYGDKQ
jgi:hypothetical protein